MKAREWIDKKGWTLQDTLDAVQKVDPSITITVPQVSKLVRGLQWPSRNFVRAFATLTRGKVDANSWAGIK